MLDALNYASMHNPHKPRDLIALLAHIQRWSLGAGGRNTFDH